MGQLVLAACDKDALGKDFEEGELAISVSTSFYGQELVDEEEFVDLALRCSTLNIVGNDVVACAIRNGLVDEIGVKKIAGIPYAMSFVIDHQ